MEIKYNLPTLTSKQFYQTYLALVSSFSPVCNLTAKEREVMALFMYYNNEYKSMPIEDRNAYLFSTFVRNKIKEDLQLKSNVFNNIVSSLRKKKAIVNNSLEKFYLLNIKDKIEITFNYTIDDI